MHQPVVCNVRGACTNSAARDCQSICSVSSLCTSRKGDLRVDCRFVRAGRADGYRRPETPKTCRRNRDTRVLIQEYADAGSPVPFGGGFALAFSLLHVRYALLLSLIAAPLEFIPLVGPFVAGVSIVGACEFNQYRHTGAVLTFLFCTGVSGLCAVAVLDEAERSPAFPARAFWGFRW